MAQYDIHEWDGGGDIRYVVDVQSGLLSGMVTRVVIPLRMEEVREKPITVLNPLVEIDNDRYFLSTAELSGVHESALGDVIGSMTDRHDDILAAIDLLITGI